MTKTRRAVLESFLGSDGPQALIGVREALSKRGCEPDRTTLYRELRFLIGAGIVSESGIAKRGRIYELVRGHRHHLVCLGCREVRSVPFDDHLHREEERILRDERFRVLGHELEFYGYCERCR